jgi:hypothetical protein
MSNFQFSLIVFDGILIAAFAACYVMAIISLIKAKISK